MRRREFITLLSGAAIAWPVVAHAQQTQVPVIGFLSARSPADSARFVTAFRRGLSEVGYVEGQNVAIEYRWAEGQYDQLPTLATDLVDRHVNVLFAAGGMTAVLAAKAATSTIPVVFSIGGDPIELGLVASLNRPGGNLTGVNVMGVALLAKRLELLREVIPNVSVIALLVNPANPYTEVQLKEMDEAAGVLGRRTVVVNVSSEGDFDTAFASLVRRGAGALLITSDVWLHMRADRLGELAARHMVPAISEVREFAAAGGL